MIQKIIKYLMHPFKIKENLNNRYIRFFLERKKNSFDKKNIIYFLHVGKCAGTSISYILKNTNLSNYNNFFFLKMSHNIKLKNLEPDAKYIINCRNPIDRFVSGFYSRKRKGKKGLSEWSKDERSSFNFFDDANMLAEAISSLDKETKKKANFAMNSISHINNHFCTWLSSQDLERRPPMFIFQQEELSSDIELFLEKFNIEKNLKFLNVNKHKFNYKNTSTLSDVAKQNLKRWYEKDFDLYNDVVKIKKKINNN